MKTTARFVPALRTLLAALLALALALSLTALLAGCGGDAEGATQVVLSWDEPVDMDLEIWDPTGEGALTSAGLTNEDVFDGTEGSEYFDFVDHGETGDFSQGEYVVSVYFAEETDEIAEADILLTVTQPDGTVLTREGTVYWEVGRDQWHAFRVDAATGAIEDMDEFIETEVLDEG